MQNDQLDYYLAECRREGLAPMQIDFVAIEYFGREYADLTAVEAMIAFDIYFDVYPVAAVIARGYHSPAPVPCEHTIDRAEL